MNRYIGQILKTPQYRFGMSVYNISEVPNVNGLVANPTIRVKYADAYLLVTIKFKIIQLEEEEQK